MDLYAICKFENYDQLTNTCSNIEWNVRESFLPTLSYQDSLIIGSSILGIFALVFSFKIVRKFLFK